MAEFQTVLGIVLIVVAVLIVTLSIYNMVIIGKATIDTEDVKSTITDGERKGALGVNIILIIIGLVLGVYGIIVLLPEDKVSRRISELRVPRSSASPSLAGSYL